MRDSVGELVSAYNCYSTSDHTYQEGRWFLSLLLWLLLDHAPSAPLNCDCKLKPETVCLSRRTMNDRRTAAQCQTWDCEAHHEEEYRDEGLLCYLIMVPPHPH